MIPKIFYRKLWDPGTIERWNAYELTSQHPHCEPPLWADLRGKNVKAKSRYSLASYLGKGISLPSARDKYHELLVKVPGALWEPIDLADKRTIQEQAGVFCVRKP